MLFANRPAPPAARDRLRGLYTDSASTLQAARSVGPMRFLVVAAGWLAILILVLPAHV